MICWWTHIGLPSLSLPLCLSHTHTNQVCKELWVWVNITSQQFWGVKIALALQDIFNFLLNIITLAWLCMETTPMRMHPHPHPPTPTHTHTLSHIYCLCAVSLLSKTNLPSSHYVTAHVTLILVLHFIRQGAECELFWEENGNSLLVAQLKRRLQ